MPRYRLNYASPLEFEAEKPSGFLDFFRNFRTPASSNPNVWRDECAHIFGITPGDFDDDALADQMLIRGNLVEIKKRKYEGKKTAAQELKNGRGEYEFWLIMQEGFLHSGRHKSAFQAIKMAVQGYDYRVDDFEVVKTMSSNLHDDYGAQRPAQPEIFDEQHLEIWAEELIAALYAVGQIKTHQTFTWRPIAGFRLTGKKSEVKINVKSRSSIGFFRGLAVKHRAQTSNLEGHRHGVESFVKDLQLCFENYFEFPKGLSHDQFLWELCMYDFIHRDLSQ